jgi:hypothetical protein
MALNLSVEHPCQASSSFLQTASGAESQTAIMYVPCLASWIYAASGSSCRSYCKTDISLSSSKPALPKSQCVIDSAVKMVDVPRRMS